MNRQESKYQYTASLMDEALLLLLEQKDYDAITVKEICQKAGVNRSTFYLHYESMNEGLGRFALLRFRQIIVRIEPAAFAEQFYILLSHVPVEVRGIVAVIFSQCRMHACILGVLVEGVDHDDLWCCRRRKHLLPGIAVPFTVVARHWCMAFAVVPAGHDDHHIFVLLRALIVSPAVVARTALIVSPAHREVIGVFGFTARVFVIFPDLLAPVAVNDQQRLSVDHIVRFAPILAQVAVVEQNYLILDHFAVGLPLYRADGGAVADRFITRVIPFLYALRNGNGAVADESASYVNMVRLVHYYEVDTGFGQFLQVEHYELFIAGVVQTVRAVR
ncbi:MAG: TetR/AcrR family transcriptional regulator [Clostridia bacterium]|nr:TetR/AcrR family transcriptional regulator [Clostridia bacterium]